MKRVRRACAESIVELAKVQHIPSRLRNESLVDLWKKLERDQMRTVKYAALQKLGYFIATFAPPYDNNKPRQDISGDRLKAVNELIPYFTSMAFIKTGDTQEEAEIRLHCAFCFPAVVYTVGIDGWMSLRDAFFHLARGPEEEIPGGKANTNNTILRRCLACSLHEIAKVLGEKVVEIELMPLYEAFLKDSSEDVRLSALRNFHEIIGVVSVKIRDPLLDLLNDMLSTSSPMNWRMRNSVALQLNQIISYFKAYSIRNKIAPLVFKLLDDPVAEVREKTYSSVPTLLKYMFWVNIVKNEVPDNFADQMDAEEWSSKAIKEVLRVLQSLPTMEDFSHRQSYCQITGCMANSVTDATSSNEEIKFFKRILTQDLIPLVLTLKDDKVSNVRTLLRKCLQCMPDEIVAIPEVSSTLIDLQKEEELWEEAPIKSHTDSSRRNGRTNTTRSTARNSRTDSLSTYELRTENHEEDESSVASSASSRRGRTKREKQNTTQNRNPIHGKSSSNEKSGPSQRRKKQEGDDDGNEASLASI